MDAAQNHYETFGAASPMIFFDEEYWTDTRPIYPLLQTLAADTPYADQLQVTDDSEAVADAIQTHGRGRDADLAQTAFLPEQGTGKETLQRFAERADISVRLFVIPSNSALAAPAARLPTV